MKKLLVLGAVLAMVASGTQLSATSLAGRSASSGISAGTYVALGAGILLAAGVAAGAYSTQDGSGNPASSH